MTISRNQNHYYSYYHHQYDHRHTGGLLKKVTFIFLAICFCLTITTSLINGQQSLARAQAGRRPGPGNRRGADKPVVLRDAFWEDNNFVVRIRTTYNQTSSITCNAIVLDRLIVMSDVTCIKYQGMFNIDARYVSVIAGESYNETIHEVEQIYINKVDTKDPSTELAILKLNRPLDQDTQCRELLLPPRNLSLVEENPVRVIGYTTSYELKENRSKVSRRGVTLQGNNKYICTFPAEPNETPGSQLLKGAPLLNVIDCKNYQLVGILTKTETFMDTNVRKQQDCYVLVSSVMRWYDQVRMLTSQLAAKKDAPDDDERVTVVESNEPPGA